MLFFDHPELREKAERLRKRSGHLLSKMRYVSAQLLTYIENGLWLRPGEKRESTSRPVFAQAVVQHPECKPGVPGSRQRSICRVGPPQGFEQSWRSPVIQFLMPGQDRDDLARFVFLPLARSSEETEIGCAHARRLELPKRVAYEKAYQHRTGNPFNETVNTELVNGTDPYTAVFISVVA